MCFKKPKMPEPTAEEIAAEKELKQQREALKAQLAAEKAEAKERRTREAISRATGTYGFRSLISGRKGGQGFMSRGLLG
jgi:hypothetical protein